MYMYVVTQLIILAPLLEKMSVTVFNDNYNEGIGKKFCLYRTFLYANSL